MNQDVKSRIGRNGRIAATSNEEFERCRSGNTIGVIEAGSGIK